MLKRCISAIPGATFWGFFLHTQLTKGLNISWWVALAILDHGKWGEGETCKARRFQKWSWHLSAPWDFVSQSVYCVFPAVPHLIQLMKHSLISSWADSGAGTKKNPQTNLHSVVGLQALRLALLIPSYNTPDAIHGMLEKTPIWITVWWWINVSPALTHHYAHQLN